MGDGPVGRKRAWQRLATVLEARKPALVLVAGPPGSGRTHLLRAAGKAAHALGFTVIGGDEPVEIDRTIKLSDVRRILGAMLNVGDEASGERQPTAPKGRLGRMLGTVVRSVRDEQAVFAMLEEAAPAVLAIDGYAPSTTLSSWLGSRLIPHVLASPGPVIVIIADRLEAMTALRDKAAEVIELGPLDPEEVGHHLRTVGAALQPPLSGDEVAAYCEAVADDPGLLTPLTDVLTVLGEDPGEQPAGTGKAELSAAQRADASRRNGDL